MRPPANIRSGAVARSTGLRGHGVRLLLAFLSLMALPFSSAAAEQVSKEYQVKAVFLFRLAQFVEWPTNRFGDTNSPVIIGVLGANPFGGALTLAVRGETAHGRPIEIRELKRDEDPRACHIVFIARSEDSRAKQIISTLSGQSVLTVGDAEGFVTAKGGMVRFKTDQNKVTLRINPDAAKAVGLVLDSRLLRMAEIVGNQ